MTGKNKNQKLNLTFLVKDDEETGNSTKGINNKIASSVLLKTAKKYKKNNHVEEMNNDLQTFSEQNLQSHFLKINSENSSENFEKQINNQENVAQYYYQKNFAENINSYNVNNINYQSGDVSKHNLCNNYKFDSSLVNLNSLYENVSSNYGFYFNRYDQSLFDINKNTANLQEIPNNDLLFFNMDNIYKNNISYNNYNPVNIFPGFKKDDLQSHLKNYDSEPYTNVYNKNESGMQLFKSNFFAYSYFSAKSKPKNKKPKEFICDVPGCNKIYKSLCGITWHLAHGHVKKVKSKKKIKVSSEDVIKNSKTKMK